MIQFATQFGGTFADGCRPNSLHEYWKKVPCHYQRFPTGVGPVFDFDLDMAGAGLGVIHDIRESFQRDPIGGYFHGSRERRHRFGHIKRNLQAIWTGIGRDMLFESAETKPNSSSTGGRRAYTSRRISATVPFTCPLSSCSN